ncbi:ROK family protein [Mesorhizobium sp. LCM 4577]|uniref:ROK family protein n=1 Tax=Mesorhizobium sp. LCM 4577 TaxID=1848288 RepID=UPI000E2E67F9
MSLRLAGILGRAIAGACNILNPEVIVVAGDFLPAGELFVQPLREAFSRHANSPRRIGNGSYDRNC